MERVVDGKRGVYRVPALGERGIWSVTTRPRKSGQRNNLHDCVNNTDDRGNREEGGRGVLAEGVAIYFIEC